MAAETDFWRWQPHPEVWLLLAGLVGLYLYALRRIGPRTRAVREGAAVATRANKVWFGVGVATLWLAADWPMHDIAEEHLYLVHMIQHLLLTFVVPPVLLMAVPTWLARLLVGGDEPGRIGSALLWLARPVPALVAFNGLALLTHWSVLVNLSVENGLFHYAVHAAMVVTAIALWMPVCGPLPERRISMPAQMGYLFITSIVPTVPAAWLTFADGVIYDAYDDAARLWGIGVTSDQQAAGLIMKLAGGGYLWIIIIVIFFRWAMAHEKAERAGRIGANAASEREILTWGDVEAEFERLGPPPKEPAP